jgi:hypothetical protein
MAISCPRMARISGALSDKRLRPAKSSFSALTVAGGDGNKPSSALHRTDLPAAGFSDDPERLAGRDR